MADEPTGKEDNPAAQRALEKVARLPIKVINGAATPESMDEQLLFANWAITSGLLPKEIDTPSKAWLVMQRGAELGLSGLGAFDFLYVVNGRVRITPDCVKAKALASGLLDDVREEIVGDGDAMMARVTVRRNGLKSPIVAEFSVADAKGAKLWSKGGSWTTYPKRMLLARARGFAFGDAFRDLCGGLPVRERVDLEPDEVLGGERETVAHAAAVAPQPPATKDPLFEEPVEAEVVATVLASPDVAKVEQPPKKDSKGRTILEEDEKGEPLVVAKARPMTHQEADLALAAEERGR